MPSNDDTLKPTETNREQVVNKRAQDDQGDKKPINGLNGPQDNLKPTEAEDMERPENTPTS